VNSSISKRLLEFEAVPTSGNPQTQPNDHPHGLLLPATPRGWFIRWFTKYTPKLIAKKFYAMRVDARTATVLRDLNDHQGPMLCVMNHSSWWDPLVGFALHTAHLPARDMRAPMDRAQLERFWFFRSLGIFGIEPDNPASLEAMRTYLSEWFAAQPKASAWITPQGDFQDVRDELTIRPGAAALAASCGEQTKVVSVAIEYTFWTDQKPELFLRFAEVVPEKHSTTGWHRALTTTMQANQAELARLVIERKPAAFTNLIGGEVSKTNPMWDLFLKLRGKQGAIAPARRNGSPASSSPTGSSQGESA